MKNASLVGLIGVIIQIVHTLIWWIVPYSSNAFIILSPLGKILSIAAYLCFGYFFLKMYQLYKGR